MRLLPKMIAVKHLLKPNINSTTKLLCIVREDFVLLGKLVVVAF